MATLPSAASRLCEPLLVRWRAFCFPQGEELAKTIRSLRIEETGQMRMSREARWIPFTSEQILDCTRSSSRWEAKLDPGRLTSPTVIDAYEQGHGYLAVKIAGLLPVRKITGPDADRGELQRYLASVIFCPPMLLNHPYLDCAVVAPTTARLRDRNDPQAATVDIEIDETGRPLGCRAIRPMTVGKKAVLTPWSGTCSCFKTYEGIRVASRLEVSWDLPEGSFLYYRSEVKSVRALR